MEAGTAFYVKQGTVYLIKLVGDIRYSMGCAACDDSDCPVDQLSGPGATCG